ncbi:prolactin-like [Erethizon dorsatum]
MTWDGQCFSGEVCFLSCSAPWTSRGKQKLYLKHKFFFMPAVKDCNTTHIRTPAGKKVIGKMQYEDIISMVLRLLLSWNEPLLHLAKEAHRLPMLRVILTIKERVISDENHQLQNITSQIATLFDLEVADKMDYALWSEHRSLRSPDTQSSLFAIYNTLHCLYNDTQRIHILLTSQNCLVFNEHNC